MMLNQNYEKHWIYASPVDHTITSQVRTTNYIWIKGGLKCFIDSFLIAGNNPSLSIEI